MNTYLIHFDEPLDHSIAEKGICVLHDNLRLLEVWAQGRLNQATVCLTRLIGVEFRLEIGFLAPLMIGIL